MSDFTRLRARLDGIRMAVQAERDYWPNGQSWSTILDLLIYLEDLQAYLESNQCQCGSCRSQSATRSF